MKKYIILDTTRTNGGICIWWKPNRMGYTNDKEKAGLYSYAEAKEICSNVDDAVVYRYDKLPERSFFHMQDLYNIASTVNTYLETYAHRVSNMQPTSYTLTASALNATKHTIRPTRLKKLITAHLIPSPLMMGCRSDGNSCKHRRPKLVCENIHSRAKWEMGFRP